MCQMITDKTIKDLDEGRMVVRESFDVKVYQKYVNDRMYQKAQKYLNGTQIAYK